MKARAATTKRRLMKDVSQMGDRHRAVDSCAPSILLSPVQIPSTPSLLFPVEVYCTIFVIVLRKGQNKHKRGRVWPIYKKDASQIGMMLVVVLAGDSWYLD